MTAQSSQFADISAPIQSTDINQSNTLLRIYSKLLVCFTLFLIFIGALVTSHDAGLSVPDWPQTYGQNMFMFPYSKWIGGIFYEHGHRLFASIVGLLTVIQAALLFKFEKRKFVRILGYISIGTVISQGLLGGITVLLQLSDIVSSLHAFLAQTFLLILTTIAFTQSKEFNKRSESQSALIFNRSLWAVGSIYIQLLLGAFMRHNAAGIAVPDFPTMGGYYLPMPTQAMLASVNQLRANIGLPAATMGMLIMHLLHRVWAIIVVSDIIAVVVFIFKKSSSSRVRKNGSLLLFLLVLQITLGIVTVLSVRDPIFASIHVVVGAVFLLSTYLVTLRTFNWDSVGK